MSWTNKSIERYEEQLRERWMPDGRQITLEMRMSEPTFDVIKGADGINRPYPKEASDIYRKYAEMNFGRAENTREICGND